MHLANNEARLGLDRLTCIQYMDIDLFRPMCCLVLY